MSRFTLHNQDDAPDASKELLRMVESKFGFTPNLTRILAEAPAALEAYLTLGRLLEQSSLTPHEQEVVILTISLENQCEYCIAVHTAVAKIKKLDPRVLEALRAGDVIPDARLQALSRFTAAVVRQRGQVPPGALRAFFLAGFTRQQVLEIVVATSLKVLSNYANLLAETPLDAAFAPHAWEPPVGVSGGAEGVEAPRVQTEQGASGTMTRF